MFITDNSFHQNPFIQNKFTSSSQKGKSTHFGSSAAEEHNCRTDWKLLRMECIFAKFMNWISQLG